MKISIVAVIFLAFAASLCESKLEPYRVLGVDRRASSQEIKKAYKNLAREWHPDKNSDPGAQDKFVEINAAYELLNDPERRKRFDTYGVVDERPGGGHHPEDHRHHFRRFHSPFDFFDGHDFFRESGFHSQSGNSGNPGLYHKQMINSHVFFSQIQPESTVKPYLILFFSDWCFTCLRIEPIWAKLTEELEPVGFGIVTVHADRNRDLARKIGSNELPHISLLLDAKVIHYKDPQFSALRVLDFVRSKMPYKLVELVDSSNLDSFLNGWHDNRVRVLLFGKTEVIRLRYLTTAYKFRSRAKLGYVRITDGLKTRDILKRYNVAKNTDTMLVFHEDAQVPVAVVAMQDLALKTLFEVIEGHKFLTLPRLSSQTVFDLLCPPESSRAKKKLCVILINKGQDHQDADEELKRTHLRAFIQDAHLDLSRVKFAYVLEEVQSDFVKAIKDPKTKDDLNLAIVWRLEAKKVKYEWFKLPWSSKKDELKANKTETELKATLQKLLSPNEVLEAEAVFNELFDEHSKSLLLRILHRVLDTWDWVKDNLTREEVLPTVSLIGAVAFVFIGAQCMQYLVAFDDDDNEAASKRHAQPVQQELKLIEFKAETYNGLVRLLRPGCRTLILICDQGSRVDLTKKFFKIMWPYRRNKTLNFGYMLIEKGLPWFTQILHQTTDSAEEDGKMKINAKNCVGTVLALNGHRKYFCMYHAKHPEKFNQRNAGSFMGFDNDSDSDSDSEVNLRRRLVSPPSQDGGLSEDQLLDHLPLWLDRLFEGLTQRYHLSFWPDFPVYSSTSNPNHHMHSE